MRHFCVYPGGTMTLRSAHSIFRDTSPTTYSFLSSGADIRDAGPSDLGRMRLELDRDLFLFAWVVMGNHWLTPHFHYPMCQFLSRWGEPDWKRLGLCVPRDVGKTTLGTRANALWQVCRSQGHLATVAIFNAKESNSAKWLRQIMRTVESNPIFHKVYEDMLPPGVAFGDERSLPKRWKWNETEIEFVRDFPAPPEASITALGIGGAATGGHWSHAIKDDIIGLEESRSEAAMESAIAWADSARDLESPAQAGNDLWNYTPWHYADVNRHRDEKWGDEYRIFKRSAFTLDPEGIEVSSFPEKWSTDKLMKMRETDFYTFASQYALHPRPGRAQALDDTWLLPGTVLTGPRCPSFVIAAAHWDSKRHKLLVDEPTLDAPQVVPTLAMEKALLWDPAPSEGELHASDATKSRNGMVMVGRDAFLRDFILQVESTLYDPLETIRRAVRMCIAWQCYKVVVEEVNFAKLYKHFVDYVLRSEFKGVLIQFLPIPYPKGQKDMRVQGLISDFRQGFIYGNDPLVTPLKREMREYLPGHKKGIDCLDAFAMKDLPGILPRPRTTLELFREELKVDKVRASVRRRGGYDRINWAPN